MKDGKLRFRIAIVLAAVMSALSGCAVGPDFRSPDAPATERFTATPLPPETAVAPVTGGEAQRFVPGREIPSQWWTLFRSEPLDKLIRQAIADSPTLAAGQAALRQAMENRRARFGAFFPSVDAGFSASRRQFTGASFGRPDTPGGIFTLYNASVSVSYSLDLFGETRRSVEALQARSDYQHFLQEGTYLALTANIVTAAAQEASLRARLRATNEIIAIEEEQLRLVERRFQLGGASRSDVLAQQAQVAQTRTTLPPLEKELAQTRHLLAALAGKLPGDAAQLPVFELADLRLPTELPAGLPSEVVRQRPDIRASEELLHEASARIGVATANLYPQLSISGDYGTEALRLNDLFSNGSAVWSIGANLLQPIFRGGTLRAERRAAIAAYDQAEAQYRETVLLAFRNVADVLRALELDARTLQAQAAAEKAARESLQIAQEQYRLGAVSYLTMLNAQRQHQQALLSLAQAQAARLADTAALFQALGGGWWNRGSEDGITKLSEKSELITQ